MLCCPSKVFNIPRVARQTPFAMRMLLAYLGEKGHSDTVDVLPHTSTDQYALIPSTVDTRWYGAKHYTHFSPGSSNPVDGKIVQLPCMLLRNGDGSDTLHATRPPAPPQLLLDVVDMLPSVLWVPDDASDKSRSPSSNVG